MILMTCIWVLSVFRDTQLKICKDPVPIMDDTMEKSGGSPDNKSDQTFLAQPKSKYSGTSMARTPMFETGVVRANEC